MPHNQSFSTLVGNTQKDQAEATTQQIVAELLESRTYSTAEAQNWAAEVTERTAAMLKDLSSGFKYAVTCILLQKGEASLHVSSTCLWDSTADGSFAIRWENATMHCVVNVFALVY